LNSADFVSVGEPAGGSQPHESPPSFLHARFLKRPELIDAPGNRTISWRADVAGRESCAGDCRLSDVKILIMLIAGIVVVFSGSPVNGETPAGIPNPESSENRRQNGKIKLLLFYGHNSGFDLIDTVIPYRSNYFLQTFGFHQKMGNEEKVFAFELSYVFDDDSVAEIPVSAYVDKIEGSLMISYRKNPGKTSPTDRVDYSEHRSQNIYEIAPAIVLRWIFSLNEQPYSIGMGQGLSYVSEIPAYETKCMEWYEWWSVVDGEKKITCVKYRESEPLLFYVLLEITSRLFSLNQEIVYRIQHRSGLNKNGSNVYGIGLRFFY